MRSFIKSHRRNGSSVSDEAYLEEIPPIVDSSTPAPSPKLLQLTQFATPKVPGTSSAKSSPKKLLTPIKNLFSSSNLASKGNTPVETSKPKRILKSNRNSLSSVSDSQPPKVSKYEKTKAPANYLVKTSHSTPSFTGPFHETPHTSLASIATTIVGNEPKLEPPIALKSAPSRLKQESQDDTGLSFVESEFRFDSRQVSFESPVANNKTWDSSDEEDISDTSSQFSFIEDRKGGRNTSVKYYKNPVKQEPINTFVAQDMGYDDEDLAEYDFENNGLDYGEDDDEEDVNYNQAFDDDMDEYKAVPEYDSRNEDADDCYSYCDDEEVGYNKALEVESAYTGGSINNSEEYFSTKSSQSRTKTPVDLRDVRLNDHREVAKQIPDLSNKNNDDVTFDAGTGDFSFNTNALNTEHSYYSIPEVNHQDEEKNKNFFYKNHNFPITSLEKERHPFYLCYHMSIEGLATSGLDSEDSNNYGDDILENYLDTSKLPSTDPPSLQTKMMLSLTMESFSSENSDLIISSPVITGLTIGNNLSHRSRRHAKSQLPDSKLPITNRSFIHREDDNTVPKPCNTILHLNDSPDSEYASFQLTLFKSFHTSISHDMNTIISEKVGTFDRFSNNMSKSPNVIPLLNEQDKSGRKITQAESSELKLIPSESINQIMTILNEISNSPEENNVESATPNNSRIKLQRSSILGMMDILASLENSQPEILEGAIAGVPTKENRKSIIEMLSVLDSIASSENSKEKGGEILSKRNHDDLVDTQAARIRQRNSQKSKVPTKTQASIIQESELGTKDNTARHSWYFNDESLNLKAPNEINSNSFLDTKKVEDLQENVVLDQDLIDEINQLPEDFDFEEHELRSRMESIVNRFPSFYRSNSYNKKPVKAVRDTNYQQNKIETSNKTVTFYGSLSVAVPSEITRIKSINRATSLKSVNSFASVNEESEDEDDYFSSAPPQAQAPLKSPLEQVLSALEAQSGANLTTISEKN